MPRPQPVAVAAAGPNPARRIDFTAPIRATVDYAVDGDTLRVRLSSDELTYVRLIGIDTPEDVKPGYSTECGAKAAAASMDRLAPDGAAVTLRPDSVAGAEDRYGRLLAHAFVGGHQLELTQLRRGLAYVYRYDNQRFDGLPAFEARRTPCPPGPPRRLGPLRRRLPLGRGRRPRLTRACWSPMGR